MKFWLCTKLVQVCLWCFLPDGLCKMLKILPVRLLFLKMRVLTQTLRSSSKSNQVIFVARLETFLTCTKIRFKTAIPLSYVSRLISLLCAGVYIEMHPVMWSEATFTFFCSKRVKVQDTWGQRSAWKGTERWCSLHPQRLNMSWSVWVLKNCFCNLVLCRKNKQEGRFLRASHFTHSARPVVLVCMCINLLSDKRLWKWHLLGIALLCRCRSGVLNSVFSWCHISFVSSAYDVQSLNEWWSPTKEQIILHIITAPKTWYQHKYSPYPKDLHSWFLFFRLMSPSGIFL